MDKKELTKLLTTFIIGDGGVYYSGSNNCRLIVCHTSDHEDYSSWKQSIIENLTSTNKRTYVDKRTDFNRKEMIYIESKTHPFFTKLRERYYIENRRVIDPHFLKLIDAHVLAILYQDDGNLGYDKRCNGYYNIRLNMKRYSYGDLSLLKKSFKTKLDLEFNVERHYKYFLLNLRRKDNERFMCMVKPFIFPSFQYKLMPEYRVVCPNKLE